MADPLSPLPLSGQTAGRVALLEAADPGFIARTNPAHLLTAQGLFRFTKQILTVEHTVEMNSHWYVDELERLGYKNLDSTQDAELDAMVHQVKVEYPERHGPGFNFPRDYSKFIELLKRNRGYRPSGLMTGQIQEALVKINPAQHDEAGRHIREHRVYIFNQGLTAETWTGFADRKPFFHAFAGTSTEPLNYHRAVATTVRFTGADADVWPVDATTEQPARAFAVGCHEVTYWLERRRRIAPNQDNDVAVSLAQAFGVWGSSEKSQFEFSFTAPQHVRCVTLLPRSRWQRSRHQLQQSDERSPKREQVHSVLLHQRHGDNCRRGAGSVARVGCPKAGRRPWGDNGPAQRGRHPESDPGGQRPDEHR